MEWSFFVYHNMLCIKTMWKKQPGKHHANNGLLDTSETAVGKSSSTNIPGQGASHLCHAFGKVQVSRITQNLKNSRDAGVFTRSAPTTDGTISPPEGSFLCVIQHRSEKKSTVYILNKEHLIYGSPAIGATVAPNGNPVSTPASNSVGAGQDRRLTSDKSSVPFTSNVAQGQEEVNRRRQCQTYTVYRCNRPQYAPGNPE